MVTATAATSATRNVLFGIFVSLLAGARGAPLLPGGCTHPPTTRFSIGRPGPRLQQRDREARAGLRRDRVPGLGQAAGPPDRAGGAGGRAGPRAAGAALPLGGRPDRRGRSRP